jgi:hypothetical protein
MIFADIKLNLGPCYSLVEGCMSDQESLCKGYVKGYEEGLHDALEELISITMKRNYTTTEIRLLAKNQRLTIEDKVNGKKRQILKKYGIDLNADGQKHDLRKSFEPKKTYLINENESPGQAFKVLSSLVSMGMTGLCISRLPPEVAQKRFGDKCTIFWLTKTTAPSSDADPEQKLREQYIAPDDMTKVQNAIKAFLTLNKEKSTVILLEGLNMMLTNTDPRGFLKVAQKLKDDVYQAHSILLIPIDPTTMEPREFNLFMGELES